MQIDRDQEIAYMQIWRHVLSLFIWQRIYSKINESRTPPFTPHRQNSYLCRMEQLLEQIAAYRQEIGALIPGGADALEAYRIRFLGTKGIVKNLFTEMRNVPADKKKEFGQILNEFKQFAESRYETWAAGTARGQEPAT